MLNSMKYFLSLIFLLLLFTSTSSASVTKKILILYSLQPHMPAYEVLDQNFRNLQLNQDTKVEYFTEYLEQSRFRDETSIKKQADLINHKYRTNKPDIIIAVMSPALVFIQKHCKTTFKNTPIVYALIDKKVDPKNMEIKATGVNFHIDLLKTLKAALSIQPETRDVYVIAGASALGRSWESQAKEKFQQLSGQINFHYLAGLSMVEILHKVRKLPPQAIVLYLLIFKDASGNSFVPRDALNTISRSSSVPVYGLWNTYVGHGIIGGHLCSSDVLGKNVNKMVIRILNGESIDKVLPKSLGPSIDMFDWQQMKRFGISEKRIPDKSIILFKTQTVWGKYRIYIVSFFIFALAESILILVLAMNVKKRKIAEIDLGYSNNRYKTLFQDSPIPLWEEDFSAIYEYFSKLRENGITDFKSYFDKNPAELSICAQKIKIIDVNQAALLLHKAKNKNELIGNIDKIFTEKSLEVFKEEVITLSEGKLEFESEAEVQTLSGEVRYIFIKMIIDQKQKKLGRILISTTDLTERKKAQEKLRQTQKMESIGNLAGGIAHDFNNLLYPIIGFAELLKEDLPPDSLEHESAHEIFNAGKRGRELVKQILAFSRQAEHILSPVRFQKVLIEVLKLTRSTIPSDITIHNDIQQSCGYVMAEPTQLHQIAMNLITNAYHAVEDANGIISVELKEISMDSSELEDSLLKPGKYAMLTVSDNGCGIPRNVINNIFEPYFTTKEKGKGTGLGLAVVHGIVREHKGDIKVYSEEGKGSTFNVYIPLMKKSTETVMNDPFSVLPTGTESLLLVDDEEAVVRLEKQMLERLGYKVTAQSSSIDALKLFKINPDDYDLVITDMAMPNMTGDKLAKEILSIKSDIPVIICTGFSQRINKEQAEAIGVNGFLMKPVVKSDMAKMVRKVLDKI